MKLLQILENVEQGIKEQGGLLRALGSGIKTLGKQSDDIIKTFKDVIKFTGNKGEKGFVNASGKKITTANDLYKNAVNGTLKGGDVAAEQLVSGMLKSGSLPSNMVADFAKSISATDKFRKVASTHTGPSLEKHLKKLGYTDEAAIAMRDEAKRLKFLNTASKTKVKPKTDVKPKVDPKSVKGGLRKVYDDTVSYLKGNKNAAKNLGNLPKSSRTVRLLKWMVRTSVKGVVKVWTLKWLIILGLGGYLAWNWKEWMGLGDLTKWDNDDFEPEVDFLKCILIPLGDDEGVKIESDDKGNPVLYYIKGSSYDDQGGLIFRVDGSVETGDGSKKGTWSCNTSGLDIQEQSTGSEITSKELSVVIEDLNDNLSGDLFDGDSTDMVDALNIVKGVVGKTYKGKTAIKTIIHNYPILHGNSVIDDINSLTNLDFNGLEQKKELLSLLGLSSGKSSGGNQSGDSDAKGDSDVKGDGNTSTGISHITIKWGSGKTTPVVGKVKYVQCKDLPFKYGCISDKIKTIQKCLPAELKVDGYYGPKTSNALWNLYQGKEKSDITKSVYDKIMVACEKKDEKTKSTEPRKKVVPPIKLEPKGLAPLKVYDTESVIAKIDPAVMAANIRKTIDGRRVDQIISDELKYSFGRYVLKIDDRLTEKQLEMVNLYMATQGFKVLRKRTETPDGSKYVWKPDSKDAKRIARKERSIKKDQDKINDIKNKDNE